MTPSLSSIAVRPIVGYALFFGFGFSSWLLTTAIFSESANIIPIAPEGRALNSILDIIVNISNIPAFLIVIGQHRLGLADKPLILLLLGLNLAGSVLAMAAWDTTVTVAGSDVSLVLLAVTLLAGLIGNLAIFTFYSFAKPFDNRMTTALSTGVGSCGLIGQVMAVSQRAGRIDDNGHPIPVFSIEIFFGIILGFLVISLACFAVISTKSVGKALRRKKEGTECIDQQPFLTTAERHDIDLQEEVSKGNRFSLGSQKEREASTEQMHHVASDASLSLDRHGSSEDESLGSGTLTPDSNESGDEGPTPVQVITRECELSSPLPGLPASETVVTVNNDRLPSSSRNKASASSSEQPFMSTLKAWKDWHPVCKSAAANQFVTCIVQFSLPGSLPLLIGAGLNKFEILTWLYFGFFSGSLAGRLISAVRDWDMSFCNCLQVCLWLLMGFRGALLPEDSSYSISVLTVLAVTLAATLHGMVNTQAFRVVNSSTEAKVVGAANQAGAFVGSFIAFALVQTALHVES